MREKRRSQCSIQTQSVTILAHDVGMIVAVPDGEDVALALLDDVESAEIPTEDARVGM